MHLYIQVYTHCFNVLVARGVAMEISVKREEWVSRGAKRTVTIRMISFSLDPNFLSDSFIKCEYEMPIS